MCGTRFATCQPTLPSLHLPHPSLLLCIPYPLGSVLAISLGSLYLLDQ